MQTAEQVILNNIANANTPAFKRSRVLFGDLSYRQATLPGQQANQGWITTTGVALGSGIGVSATQTDVSQGRLRHTKQTLDLAVQGDGYFQINDGNRIFYTRAGNFTVSANGQIVLGSATTGRPLEPSFTIPRDTTQITISADGIVSVLQAGQTQLNQLGTIHLARFINPQGLLSMGQNLYQETTGSGNSIVSTPGQDGLGEIRQEHLEESNVSIDDELADLRRLREQLKALQHLHAESTGSAFRPLIRSVRCGAASFPSSGGNASAEDLLRVTLPARIALRGRLDRGGAGVLVEVRFAKRERRGTRRSQSLGTRGRQCSIMACGGIARRGDPACGADVPAKIERVEVVQFMQRRQPRIGDQSVAQSQHLQGSQRLEQLQVVVRHLAVAEVERLETGELRQVFECRTRERSPSQMQRFQIGQPGEIRQAVIQDAGASKAQGLEGSRVFAGASFPRSW